MGETIRKNLYVNKPNRNTFTVKIKEQYAKEIQSLYSTMQLGLLNKDSKDISLMPIAFGEFVEDIFESALSGRMIEYLVGKNAVRIDELRAKRETASNAVREDEIKSVQDIISYIATHMSIKRTDIKDLPEDKLTDCFNCYLANKLNSQGRAHMYINALLESDLKKILDAIREG